MRVFNPLEAWVKAVEEEMNSATTFAEIQAIYALKDTKIKELTEAYENDSIIVQEWLDTLTNGDEV